MLRKEQNDLLTQTGPGTPMGALFRRFCNGPLVVKLQSASNRRFRASVRGRREAATSCYLREWRSNLPGVVSGSLPAAATEPASPSPRPGDGTSWELGCVARSEPLLAFLCYAAAPAAGSLPQTNSVPSTQIRCSTVASLRASATFALRMPRRLATSSAQRLSVLNLVARVSSALAASCKAVRTLASPARVIAPVTSVSPD